MIKQQSRLPESPKFPKTSTETRGMRFRIFDERCQAAGLAEWGQTQEVNSGYDRFGSKPLEEASQEVRPD